MFGKRNQSRYIEKILSKFAMADCKPHSTPCEMNITKPIDEVDLIDSKPYQIISSLMYIMVVTRPDICYTVIIRLSQAKPNSFLLIKAKHVLHYLKGTIN